MCSSDLRFSNEGASLFPNQFVNVRLQLGEREGVLIPVTAVRTSGLRELPQITDYLDSIALDENGRSRDSCNENN